jgi:periplasmic protein CpxP/Spy
MKLGRPVKPLKTGIYWMETSRLFLLRTLLSEILTLLFLILHSHNAMRFSPIFFISVIVLLSPTITTTALAVPLVIRSALVDQASSSVEQINLSRPLGNSVLISQEGNRGEILQKLNLSRDQLQQISAIRQKYQPLIQDRTRTVRTTQAKLKDLMASSAAPSDVKAVFQELQNRRQELQQLRFESMLAIRQTLTPAQRQIFETELNKRRAEKRDRR